MLVTQMFFCLFLDTRLLPAHVERVGVSRMQDFYHIGLVTFAHFHREGKGQGGEGTLELGQGVGGDPLSFLLSNFSSIFSYEL